VTRADPGRPALLVFDTPADAAAHVGRAMADTLAQAPDTVPGLAVGATMLPLHHAAPVRLAARGGAERPRLVPPGRHRSVRLALLQAPGSANRSP